MADIHTRAARVATVEMGRGNHYLCRNRIGYLLAAMDQEYRSEWPQSAVDWAERLLSEAKRDLWQTGRTWNGYCLPS